MSPKRKKTPPEISRKIHFYRAVTDPAGDEDPTPFDPPFDPTGALNHINQLGFSAGGRYLAGAEGNTLCCWVHRPDPPQQLRLGYIRRSGLPLVEERGRLDDLQIPINAGLVEVIHIVVFKDNIVGADFNSYGPRIGSLARYLGAKCPGQCGPVKFEPLLRGDVEAELRRLESIRLFRLKISSSYTPDMAEADQDLAGSFATGGRIGGAAEVEVILTPTRRSRSDSLSRALIDITRRMVGSRAVRDAASIFKVKGRRADTGAPVEVDLLHDQLIAEEQIMRQTERGRSLDERSAYEAITRAYGNLKRELTQASSVGTEP